MKEQVQLYAARCLMIDRLQYELADIEHQIELQKKENSSIHNENLANLNVTHSVLKREIDQLTELNEGDLRTMYHDSTI